MRPMVIERTYSSTVLLVKSNVSSGCHIELGRIRYIRNVQAGESAFAFTNEHAAYTLKGRLGREKEREGRRQGRELQNCLLYTSPSPRDEESSRMPSSA